MCQLVTGVTIVLMSQCKMTSDRVQKAKEASGRQAQPLDFLSTCPKQMNRWRAEWPVTHYFVWLGTVVCYSPHTYSMSMSWGSSPISSKQFCADYLQWYSVWIDLFRSMKYPVYTVTNHNQRHGIILVLASPARRSSTGYVRNTSSPSLLQK